MDPINWEVYWKVSTNLRLLSVELQFGGFLWKVGSLIGVEVKFFHFNFYGSVFCGTSLDDFY